MQEHLLGGLFLALLGALALVAGRRERLVARQAGRTPETLLFGICAGAAAAGIAGEVLLTLATG